jgi:hypothetical protein
MVTVFGSEICVKRSISPTPASLTVLPSMICVTTRPLPLPRWHSSDSVADDLCHNSEGTNYDLRLELAPSVFADGAVISSGTETILLANHE